MLQWLKGLLRGRPSADGAPASLPLPENVPFEFVAVPGAQVAEQMASWSDRPGHLPVLLGDRSSLEQVVELMELNEDSSEAILTAGLALDIDDWMRERADHGAAYFKFDKSVSGAIEPIPALSPSKKFTGGFVKECFVGLIPAAEPWQVPAFLKPGGWNECPEPHVHVALFRRWHERYGATVTTVTNDIIEFQVARPPLTEQEALVLAREQYLYCDDIVHQGANTLGNLAAALRGSPNWYFWWD